MYTLAACPQQAWLAPWPRVQAGAGLHCVARVLASILRAMSMQVSGRLHVIYPAKQVTERFTKREFVLELADNAKYPQFVLFQLTGERCEALDAFKVGDQVQLDFNLRGREWTGRGGEVKYFNSLDVWTIEAAGTGGSPRSRAEQLPETSPLLDDDVPF